MQQLMGTVANTYTYPAVPRGRAHPPPISCEEANRVMRRPHIILIHLKLFVCVFPLTWAPSEARKPAAWHPVVMQLSAVSVEP